MQRYFGGGKWSFLFGLTLLGTPLALVKAQETNAAAQIAGSVVFYQNLVPVNGTPSEAENTPLLAIVQRMSSGIVATNIPALQDYVDTHPASPWTPSLEANLGKYYYEHGRYSKSLEMFQAAWEQVGNPTNSPTKRVADFTFAHWTRMLSSLGRTETLLSLFRQKEGWLCESWALQQILMSGYDSCRVMRTEPEIAFKCGTYAGSFVLTS